MNKADKLRLNETLDKALSPPRKPVSQAALDALLNEYSDEQWSPSTLPSRKPAPLLPKAIPFASSKLSIPDGIPETIPIDIPESEQIRIPNSEQVSVQNTKPNRLRNNKQKRTQNAILKSAIQKGTTPIVFRSKEGGWLDATHAPNEQKVYNIMYRATISKGVSEGYFSIRALMRATGIRATDTVSNALNGLEAKLSIEVLDDTYKWQVGYLFKVYSPDQIMKRRESVGMSIHPASKKIVERIPDAIPISIPDSTQTETQDPSRDAQPEKTGPVYQNLEHMNNIYNNANSASSSIVAAPTQNDDELLNQVRSWFDQLANGGTFRIDRDREAFDQIKHLNRWHILLGICYSVSRSADKRVDSLKYCLESIRKHAQDMAEFPDAVLAEIGYKTKIKVLSCIATGNWTIAEWELGRE